MGHHAPADLHGLVDMGSNGIRFSITDLSAHTARILPTLFQDRAGISLYDAQWSSGTKAPIPDAVIKDVCTAFGRFKRTCEDFGVPPDNIRVVATEATREAMNGAELLNVIKQRIGWQVKLLSKEQEGRIGSMGIASSYTEVNGLVLDLGGGSVQMSSMNTSNGEVKVLWGTSLPYGAAALSRRLEEAAKSKHLQQDLEHEVRKRLLSAMEDMARATQSDSSRPSDLPIFLSGGGFRGWGHVLMDAHPISPYPIPIINGFSVPASFFHDMPSIQAHIDESTADDDGIFRISSRRQSQLPAISFLIQQLLKVVPQAERSSVRFAQGGVREGVLFDTLPPEIRSQIPLVVATKLYAPASAKELLKLVRAAIPEDPRCRPPLHLMDLLEPFANLLGQYASLTKEARAAAALHTTTTGLLAGVHGVSHIDRATLALMLCQRWGGDVAPTDHTFLARLQTLVGPETSWWTKYIGRIGQLLGAIYPAGRIAADRTISIGVQTRSGKKGTEIVLRVQTGEEDWSDMLQKVEKVGKRKNWIGGREGWGFKVVVET